MKLDRYEFTSESEGELFTFISEGSKGRIKKLVMYSPMVPSDIYNLAFGDYDENTESINDTVTTNNNDSQKVLATVASTLYVFAGLHPKVWIYATGSTSARTRLYQIGIAKNLEAIARDFEVYGLIKEKWEPFEKERTYDAFLAKRK